MLKIQIRGERSYSNCTPTLQRVIVYVCSCEPRPKKRVNIRMLIFRLESQNASIHSQSSSPKEYLIVCLPSSLQPLRIIQIPEFKSSGALLAPVVFVQRLSSVVFVLACNYFYPGFLYRTSCTEVK